MSLFIATSVGFNTAVSKRVRQSLGSATRHSYSAKGFREFKHISVFQIHLVEIRSSLVS